MPVLRQAGSDATMIEVKWLGSQDYADMLRAMQEFTAQRTPHSQDELWVLEHRPVYTRGLSCNADTLHPSDIALVDTDRGGQMTYHGPGQLVVYLLLDLKRRHLGIKRLVRILEQSVIDYLVTYGVVADRRAGAPGVYVAGEKIAALGLRVRRGATYHGLSVNVDMDLHPFFNIDPCGFKDLRVTQLLDLGIDVDMQQVAAEIPARLVDLLQRASDGDA